jgi:hypothetical protein
MPATILTIVVVVVVVVVWLAVLSYFVLAQRRKLQTVLVSFEQIAAAEKREGGTGPHCRRADCRVPVKLSGFLRVLGHARPCRVVDLSGSGAQVLPEGGAFPVGEIGVLTVDFGEFDSATTHAKIVRASNATGTYGIAFVDAPRQFRDKALHTIQSRFRSQAN